MAQRNLTSERWLLGKGPLINPSDMGVAIAMTSFPGGKRCIKARAMKWGNQMIKWPKWLLVILKGFPFWYMKVLAWCHIISWLSRSDLEVIFSLQQFWWIFQCHVRAISWNLEGTSCEVRNSCPWGLLEKNKVGVVSFREGRLAFSGWAKPFVMLILHPWSLVS